jgi:uncharacterized protein involved in exopolysaccharide biosynthesis
MIERHDNPSNAGANGNATDTATANTPRRPAFARPGFAPPDPHAREKRIARVRLLWENRRTLFKTWLFGGIFCGLVAFLLPKSYEATVKLMPPESGSGGGAAILAALSARTGGMLGALAGDVLGVRGNGAVFVEVLESRTVADRLIEQFHLADEYKTTKIEYTRKQLELHTKINEDRKSGVISITVIDGHPDQAAAMAQSYVTELDHLVAQLSTSSARRERFFLEDRLKTVKQDLDSAATQFSEFASKNTAIDIPAQGKAMVEAAAVLQGQLIAAEAEASGLEKIYTVNNVRVKALNARIGELREQLQKLGGSNSPAEIKNDTSLYPSIRKLPILGVTYADLYRRTKIEETVYELLTQQYELAKVQEAKEIPAVKVLDEAVIPTVKSSPHRIAITAIGSVLFLIGGCFWVLYRKRWDEMDPQDPGRLLVLDISNSVAQQARKLAPATVHARAALSRIRNILRHSSQEQENSRTIARSAENKPDPSRVSHVAP